MLGTEGLMKRILQLGKPGSRVSVVLPRMVSCRAYLLKICNIGIQETREKSLQGRGDIATSSERLVGGSSVPDSSAQAGVEGVVQRTQQ